MWLIPASTKLQTRDGRHRQNEKTPVIPNEYHFIFLSSGSQTTKRPFSLIHYLAIASCQQVNGSGAINLYYDREPDGPWWERAKPCLRPIQVEPPANILGRPITHPAHKSDVLRLQILIEKGGIYLDTDVISIRPFADLQGFNVVLGQEYGVGLCNAVILARAGATFLQEWLSTYRSFNPKEWNTHSVIVPQNLARKRPADVHILDHRKFFWPMYWANDFAAFTTRPGSEFSSQSYCVHLWASITWPYLAALTPATLCEGNSEFCSLVRPYVEQWL